MFSVILVNSTYADNPLNGSAPRPFYVFARNPNSLAWVDEALQQGANALEPDITLVSCGSDPLDNMITCDSDEGGCGCSDTLVEWLDGVHARALQQPETIALIVFDCKGPVIDPDNGPVIVQAIRDHLNTGGVDIPFLISIANRSHGALFDKIIGPGAVLTLGSREGVMVDSENDAAQIVDFFRKSKQFAGNIGYGDGTTVGNVIGLFSFMDKGVYLRASNADPQAIPYVFTITTQENMRKFIDAGVDGVLTSIWSGNVAILRAIVDGRTDVVVATPDHNPFQFANETYALRVRTGNGGNDGTDADITFALHGALGTATITVDTSPVGRMESGTTSYVTIPSMNLGSLQSITVSNDGTGNAPDWGLRDISVASARYMGANSCLHYPTAVFNQTIPANGSATAFFRTDEYAWSASLLTPDGTAAHPWTLFFDAYCAVAPGGTIHVAAGQYNEKLTLTKPCFVDFWPAHGAGPAHIGGP